MRTITGGALALAIGACISSTASADATIPPKWQGVWAENLSDCELREEITTMEFQADALIFYESGGAVRGRSSEGLLKL